MLMKTRSVFFLLCPIYLSQSASCVNFTKVVAIYAGIWFRVMVRVRLHNSRVCTEIIFILSERLWLVMFMMFS